MQDVSKYLNIPKAEFKEFEMRLKYGWFHLKLYSMYVSRFKSALI